MVLVFLLAFVLAVTPAGAQTRSIVLWDATVTQNRGLVLTFKLHGDFNKFSGNVWLSGQSYDLNCHLKNTDDSILICQGANRGLDTLGYQTVQVVVNGFSFTTTVAVGPYCHDVYDYNNSYDMEQIGTFCIEAPPNYWDHAEIDTDGGKKEFAFLPGDQCLILGLGGPNFGPGWYPPYCIG